MADDGMILNFSLGDVPLKPQVKKIQGGKWRDRLKAQRNANRGSESNSSTSSPSLDTKSASYTPRSGGQNIEGQSDIQERPAKRLRAEPPKPSAYQTGKLPPGSIVIGKREGASLSQPHPHPHQPSHHPRPPNASGHVTSRLFTSNPTARTVFDDQPKTEEEEPAEPSNAPLSEGAASFHALGISRRLAQKLSGKVQLKAPTAIQAKAIPQLITDDSDAFLQAQTGSGKTLAYLLPILQRILSVEGQLRRDSGLFAIIMAPTRELCRQIDVVLAKVLPPWLVSTTVIGGESKHSEKSRIRKGVNILIATPGRLTDHLQHTKALDVGTVRWLVLDEGDRLMEMGFEDDLREIVAKIREKPLDGKTKNGVSLEGLPKRRVTVLCSATMKMDVQKLGEISLKDAVHISTSEEDEAKGEGGEGDQQVVFSAPAQLKQSFYIVPAKLRLVTLISLLKATFLRRGSVMKAIVFMSCADAVDFHFDLLKQPASSNAEEGQHSTSKPSSSSSSSSSSSTSPPSLTANTVAPAAYVSSSANPNVLLHRLHGSLPQPVRTATLGAYSQCSDSCILITTDISSRGLDVPSVELVIEYDPAFSSDDHLHRIGRTARAGRPGKAVLFLQPGCEEGYVEHLASRAGASHKAESYEGVLHKGLSLHMPFPVAHTDAKPIAEDSRSFSQRAEALQLHLEQRLLSPGGKSLLEAARKAFRSHVRAYATHVKEERKFFDMQELHLGHLAKSYALREAPTGVGRGGAKEGKKAALKEAARKKRKHGDGEGGGGGGGGGGDRFDAEDDDDEEARERERRMRMKMKSVMDAAGEFNIG
ncbi:ATP-dependent RNA helicase DBP7 [Sodiomyces alkalinus F11]|uniref:ATP-dependent RNA helicase n=1 Tax=Sodiomyces alkalinus (strain CBS 110278 / VKM F-3762 / F11) TaxID=1314773 RepID=A0A3N2Q546_SODAK|nr:ATP-dependent RNA helicase DBP7 [Sodiomyces alkalinus F11]ROT41893.1 ATP-dependent RNA helicase DBP7 [Sodiomyces alkalinus F11]